MTTDDLMPNKGIICYVPEKYNEAYINLLSDLNVTFRIMPISILQTATFGSDIQAIDLNESISNVADAAFSVAAVSELPAGMTLV